MPSRDANGNWVYSQAEYEHLNFIGEPYFGYIEGDGYTVTDKCTIKSSINNRGMHYAYDITNITSTLFSKSKQDSDSFLDKASNWISQSVDGIKKTASDIGSSYQKWYFENVTCENTSDLFSAPYDARGREILDYWLLGYGKDRVIENSKIWTEYMSNNGIIRNKLEEYAEIAVYEMEGAQVKSRNFGSTLIRDKFGKAFEIQNGYLTGYEMLHGTLNFRILNYTGRYDEASNAYIFEFSLEWGDRIDSNMNYGGDSKAKVFFKTINPSAADYNITIRWKQQVIWKPGDSSSDTKVIHQGRRIENRRILE